MANESANIIYEHNGHTEAPKFHMTAEVEIYIKALRSFPPRQVYHNLMQMADDPQLGKGMPQTTLGPHSC
ncbi:uncharacterized protein V1513DRAFT_455593 [Lipomyces chichibuensis]|uniref:uncharacterized protein n=1 Tax=Lipomyces chichibuensis TaxID=1546026 RepID=UPI003344123A